MSALPWHRPERRAHRLSLALGIVTLVTAALWLLGLPGVARLPAWFYQPLGPHVIEPTPWVLALLPVPPLFWLALRSARRGRSAPALAALVAASVAAQIAVIGMDRSTLVQRLEQGHGELFRIAHERRGSYLETMRDYEALSASGALGAFAPSKPQGTLSFYVLIDVLGDTPPIRALAAPLAAELRARPELHERAEGAAAGGLLFPFFTALALVPVYFLARRLGGTRQDGVAAAALTTTAPGLLLINYHADGALFPLLAVGSVALSVAGHREVHRGRRVGWHIGAGLLLGLGVWSNFSMLPVIGLLGVLLVVLHAEAGASPRAALQAATLEVLIVAAAALALLSALWASGLFSHPFERFASALAHHRRWKNDAIGGVFGAVGALEYWLWAGLPLLAVSLAALGPALGRLVRWQARPGDAMVLGAFAVHLVMAVATGCVEAARLWLWVTPFFAVLAARTLRARAPTGASEQLWMELAAAQLALTLLMRFCQPW